MERIRKWVALSPFTIRVCRGRDETGREEGDPRDNTETGAEKNRENQTERTSAEKSQSEKTRGERRMKCLGPRESGVLSSGPRSFPVEYREV